MKAGFGEAGNGGPEAVADCRVAVTLKGGRSAPRVHVTGTAAPGPSETDIKNLCEQASLLYGVGGAELSVETHGAPEWVLAARIEAAFKQADSTLDAPFFPADALPFRPTEPERPRRSRLYVPGDCPRFMRKAGQAGADGVVFDLEDAVAPGNKDSARILVRNALRYADLGSAEKMVRINGFPLGRKDLREVAFQGLHLVLLPKCESADQVRIVAEEIRTLRTAAGSDHRIYLLPILESALGVEHAFEIAGAAPEVVAVTLGLEDYTADLGVPRTSEGVESLWARQRLVNAAVAARVQALDSVFSDFKNPEGLRRSVRESKALGYVGKGCIHPGQVAVVNEGFTPSAAEIEQARRVVKTFEKARAKGVGVVALDGQMIDPPVAKRAVDMLRHFDSPASQSSG